jgi:glyoxylase-like metal-dependent hydrolase (beta-lactamase superfamily II)
MIPLAGHTLGHCGIAVRSGDTWLLHAGDSYFHHGQLAASPRMPLVLGYFQRRADMDRKQRIANQARLRALKLDHGDRVRIVNSHDPVDYENCRCGAH